VLLRFGLLGLLAWSAGGPAARQATAAERAHAAGGGRSVEETDPAVTWQGSWSTNPLPANSGGSARLAMDRGAQASLAFTGTSVSWLGYRDEWCGIATVSLDGELLATVDTYASPARAQARLYSVDGLDRASHTLTIEATGTHSAGSAGSWVWVDAFLVDQASFDPGHASRSDAGPSLVRSAPPGGRESGARGSRGRGREGVLLEQDDPAATWSGSWSSNSLAAHSGGSARLSMEPSSMLRLDFRGSAVTWIGYQDEWSGIAKVLVDGRLRATVDTYASPARAQAVLFGTDELPSGPHTLTIQPTGRRNPASGGSWIWVDAFSVTR
jgi:hypothetical protein